MSDSIAQDISLKEYSALTSGSAVYARPDAGILQITDADRADFLHRMTTNDINRLHPGQSAVTVLTSPTARILFVFTVLCRPDDLLLLPAPGQTAALARHLRSQIFFMDKVKVNDLSTDVARLRVLGPEAGKVLAKIEPEVADLADGQTVAHGASTILCQHSYDLPGYEVIAPRAELALLHDALLQAGAMPLTDPAVYLARRIELGRPAVGAELVEEYNPLEAGLAWACADSKGCYTGQEIIARQITYDKVTRTLVGLRSAAPLAVGAEVMVEGRSMGVVTSAAYSPAVEAPVALAIVKRPVNAPGATVTVDGVAASVIGLPFVVEAEA